MPHSSNPNGNFNPDEARRFLETISAPYPELTNHYQGISPGAGADYALLGDTDALVENARKLAEGGEHVYFEVGLLSEKPDPGSRATADTVTAIRGFWGEVDIGEDGHKGKGNPPTRAEAKRIFDAVPYKPTMLIHTGGGFQAYWMFRDAGIIKTDEEHTTARREDAQALAKGWVSALQHIAGGMGYKLDSVGDLARLFRVPGTRNPKYEGNRMARIVECDLDRLYDAAELVAWMRANQPPAAKTRATGRSAMAPIDNVRIQRAAEAIRDHMVGDGEKHDYALHICGLLRGQDGSRLPTDVVFDILDLGWTLAGRPRTGNREGLWNPLNTTNAQIEKGKSVTGGGKLEQLAPGLAGELYDIFGFNRYEEEAISAARSVEGMAELYDYADLFTKVDAVCMGKIKSILRKRFKRDFKSRELDAAVKSARQQKAAQDKPGGCPGQPQLRDRWIDSHPHTAWSRDEFKRYNPHTGLWETVPEPIVENEVWTVIEDAEHEGVVPTNHLAKSIMSAIKVRCYKSPDVWDKDMNIIVAANGAVNIDAFDLTPHSPGHFATTGVPYAFDPFAECPNWVRLMEWVDEQGDAYLETRAEELDTAPDYTGFMPSELLQEFSGYGLTPDMRLEKALLLVGMRGSGKSTVIEGVQEMVGPGRSGLLNIEDVVGSKYGYARIPGKTLLTGTEQPSVFIEHTHRIEALISGEPVHVEQKYERGYEYRPIAKILWGMNALPRIAQAGAGIFRRLLILRFPKALPPGAKDVDLKDKIRAEAPGIFLWALRGLKRLRERGDFQLPLSCQWALADFEGAADTEGRFVAEVCDVGENCVVRPRDLHRAYKLWCKVTGHSAKNETNIANDWARLGYVRKMINGNRFWYGLRINEDALSELKEQSPAFASSLYTAY